MMEQFLNGKKEYRRVLGAITYKPDWTLEHAFGKSGVDIQWLWAGPDSNDLKHKVPLTSRTWRIFYPATEEQVVRLAMAAALAAEEHEAREFFRYRGVKVFDPHASILQARLPCPKHPEERSNTCPECDDGL